MVVDRERLAELLQPLQGTVLLVVKREQLGIDDGVVPVEQGLVGFALGKPHRLGEGLVILDLGGFGEGEVGGGVRGDRNPSNTPTHRARERTSCIQGKQHLCCWEGQNQIKCNKIKEKLCFIPCFICWAKTKQSKKCFWVRVALAVGDSHPGRWLVARMAGCGWWNGIMTSHGRSQRE